ncbi:aminotransferase class I/II-fold pyridoxal phosphate-dependent enzyme (plasmid) [Streptomyces sp. BI20]|uniref:aminotransferase class I/II-fold pyridoxal phosphate-dependent enzyme n=1 Tax=Streptomyces sp. BI20 TaxID=3403460 RepID=UPI003C711870
MAALDRYGPHAAGSPAAAGETALAGELRRELGRMVGMEHVVLFPTGWAAGFGAVNALVRRDDHIVADELVHACLNEGIAAARTPHVTRTPHLDTTAVADALRAIRARDTEHGILVITESLFSMNSDAPDLPEPQRVCREHGALLLVDQAHDIGVLGPEGKGVAAAQGVHGGLDLVVGSFSKAFATNGGYLATGSEAVAAYTRYFGSTHIFSSALTPLQTAGALAAARLMAGPEGEARRATLLDHAHTLRAALSPTAASGCSVLGFPSPIVPLVVPSLDVGRTALRIAEARGVLVHLVEFPVVPRGQARFRLQLSAAHRPDRVEAAGRVLAEAVAEATRHHTTPREAGRS